MALDLSDTDRSISWSGPQLRGFRASRFVSIAAVARRLDLSISRIRQLEREAAPNAATAERYRSAVLELTRIPRSDAS